MTALSNLLPVICRWGPDWLRLRCGHQMAAEAAAATWCQGPAGAPHCSAAATWHPAAPPGALPLLHQTFTTSYGAVGSMSPCRSPPMRGLAVTAFSCRIYTHKSVFCERVSIPSFIIAPGSCRANILLLDPSSQPLALAWSEAARAWHLCQCAGTWMDSAIMACMQQLRRFSRFVIPRAI